MNGIIYVLFDPAEPEHVRYVGQTRTKARLRGHIKDANRKRVLSHKVHWIRAVMAAGRAICFRQVDAAADTQMLNDKEMSWIRYYRAAGHSLTNSTDGGDGVRNPSAETRSRISVAARGRTHSAEARARMSESQRKRAPRGPMSMEQRAKLSASARGRIIAQSTRAKISQAQIGRLCSEETRQRMSNALRGQKRGPLSEHHREVLSKTLKGRVFSETHRARLSAAQRARYAAAAETLARMG